MNFVFHCVTNDKEFWSNDCMARGRLSVGLIAQFSRQEILQNCIKNSKKNYKCMVGLQGFFESI